MLQRNDMLVPEGHGRRERARGTCYVDEPPFGFFIAGTTVKQLNGVYIRREVPRTLVRAGEDVLLYYLHMDGGCTMILSGARATEPDEDDEDRHMWRPEPVRQWLLVDEKNVDRFTHVGDTIVPGAGVRWKHVHAKSATETRRAPSYWPSFGGAASMQITPAKPDDQDELPWQVIAILDMG
jgi:hypothetical protein